MTPEPTYRAGTAAEPTELLVRVGDTDYYAAGLDVTAGGLVLHRPRVAGALPPAGDRPALMIVPWFMLTGPGHGLSVVVYGP